jgi:radical SAM superfamily enzyme YgiQ (UPF0313 family)
MKVLLVRPAPSPETIGLQHIMIVEPLELEILATLIKDDNEVNIIDMILERRSLRYFLNKYNPDVLCVTGYITHIPVMIECCRLAKEGDPRIITVAGGIYVEKFPEDIDSKFIDYRVVRNATRVFPLLIDYLKGKSDFPPGILRAGEVLDESVLPAYDFYYRIPDRTLTAKYRSRYFYVFHNKVALLKTAFGCPYKCNFCFCRIITGDSYSARPLEEVIYELAEIKEKEIYIIDDDFLLSRKRLQEFINMVKAKGIKKRYLVFGRADFIANNPDIIRDFRKIGLRTVLVGLESFKNEELSGFSKQTDRDINKEAVKVLNENNVECFAAIILSPSWDSNDFKQTAKILIELRIKFLNLQPLTPVKGTGLIIDESSLVIERSDFARWDLAHVVIRPEKISIEEYYRNIIRLYVRVIAKPVHLLGYIRYSPVMQFKMIRGIIKIHRQYRKRIAAVHY